MITSSERKVTKKKLDDLCMNESETRGFSFKLVYPLCVVEYNCTTSQDEYLCNEYSLSANHGYLSTW